MMCGERGETGARSSGAGVTGWIPFFQTKSICHAPLVGAAWLLGALHLASQADAQLLIRPSQLCCAGYARQIVDLPSLVGFADLMVRPVIAPKKNMLLNLPLRAPCSLNGVCKKGADGLDFVRRARRRRRASGGQRD